MTIDCGQWKLLLLKKIKEAYEKETAVYNEQQMRIFGKVEIPYAVSGYASTRLRELKEIDHLSCFTICVRLERDFQVVLPGIDEGHQYYWTRIKAKQNILENKWAEILNPLNVELQQIQDASIKNHDSSGQARYEEIQKILSPIVAVEVDFLYGSAGSLTTAQYMEEEIDAYLDGRKKIHSTEEETVPEDPASRIPRVQMVTMQSGLKIPKDWAELSASQKQMIEQMRHSSMLPMNSILKEIDKKDQTTKGSEVKGDNRENEGSSVDDRRAESPGSKQANENKSLETETAYTTGELEQATRALEVARQMETDGELPAIKDILQERTARMEQGEYTRMSPEEYSKAETEFNKKLHARMRLDLSEATDQRIIYSADKDATSYSELLPDGTIHINEQQIMGAGACHRTEEWIYTDGTSVSWTSDFEQNSTDQSNGVSEHSYREESIEVYENPNRQYVYSSSHAQLQEGSGSNPTTEPDLNGVAYREVQQKLDQLHQNNRHGPWEFTAN